jgi:hypothetical protein
MRVSVVERVAKSFGRVAGRLGRRNVYPPTELSQGRFFMARGLGEPPERSPSAILSQVEYPISRDELANAAAEAGFEVDAINFLRSLPDRIYQSPTDALREFAEADARFGMHSNDVRHRGDIGKEAVETGANPTRHP